MATRRTHIAGFMRKVWQYTIRANHPRGTVACDAGPAPSSATICTECRHYQDISDGFNRGVWYNMLCKATPLPEVIDHTIGAQNLFCNRFAYCRDINTNGQCSKYVAHGEENVHGQATH